jgi:hypothetical protein
MRAIVARIWRKWLARRSWKGRFGWASLWGLLERYPLPAARAARVVHFGWASLWGLLERYLLDHPEVRKAADDKKR